MSWSEVPFVGKILLGLLLIFCFTNFIYYLSGNSPYSQGDMVALVAILVVGSAVIIGAGIVFRFFNRP